MSSIIGMAVYATEKNKRDEYFYKTLESLSKTVDFSKHKLGISVNGYTDKTLATIEHFDEIITYKIFNDGNIGTAEAVNKIWGFRTPASHCIKMDDDIVIHSKDWIEEMEEVVAIDSTIGQISGKRRDLWENVYHENPFYRTSLYQLPHKTGERWVVVELTNHCIGSVVLHSWLLLDKVGYLKQPSYYGLDDSLMSFRSQKAGFKNAFLPHIHVEHIDNTPPKAWQDEKENVVKASWDEYNKWKVGYEDGSIPIYYNPFTT